MLIPIPCNDITLFLHAHFDDCAPATRASELVPVSESTHARGTANFHSADRYVTPPAILAKMSSHGLQRTRQAVDRLSNRLWVRLTLSIALICLVAWLALLLVLKDALGYVTERILVGKKRQDSQGLQEPLRRPHISATPSKEEASENRAMNVLYPLYVSARKCALIAQLRLKHACIDNVTKHTI